MPTSRPVLVLAALVALTAVAGCGDSTADAAGDLAPAGSTPSAGAASSSSASAPATTEAEPTWPDDVDEPVQGATYTAVVVAAGRDAAVQEGRVAAEERGYLAAVSDTGCLEGVADLPGVDRDGLVAAVLFDGEGPAAEFASAWTGEGLQVVGTGEVTAYCLDGADASDEGGSGTGEVPEGNPLPVAVVEPEQGGTYGAVVLAVGDPAALDPSRADVAAFGYTAATADAGCLQGLTATLGLAEDSLVSHLLFPDLATAELFADAWAARGLDAVGVAEVRAYCLD